MSRKGIPRSVRGAERRGYFVVPVTDNYVEKHNRSYVGIQIWTDRNASEHWVSTFLPKPVFAFKSEKDAMLFTLRFGN